MRQGKTYFRCWLLSRRPPTLKWVYAYEWAGTTREFHYRCDKIICLGNISREDFSCMDEVIPWSYRRSVWHWPYGLSANCQDQHLNAYCFMLTQDETCAKFFTSLFNALQSDNCKRYMKDAWWRMHIQVLYTRLLLASVAVCLCCAPFVYWCTQ